MKIEKHNTGYTLRAGGLTVPGFVLAGCAVVWGICTVIGFTHGAWLEPLLLGLLPTVFLLAFGVWMILSNWGRRIVLDSTGVHLYRTLLREQFLPWEQIADWGILEFSESGDHRRPQFYEPAYHALIFSATPYRRGEPLPPHHLELGILDYRRLTELGVFTFCESHINPPHSRRARKKVFMRQEGIERFATVAKGEFHEN